MSKDKLPPHYGHGVSGERFWPRPELDLLLRRLRLGNSISMFGLRRSGKSSLLKECIRILKEDGQLSVIEVDGQGMDAVSSLFNGIIASLPKKDFNSLRARFTGLNLPHRLRDIFDLWRGRDRESQTDTALVTRHWASMAQLITQLIPAMETRPVLIFDEITYLCENLYKQEGGSAAEVTRLLTMLSEWREKGMVMAIAGSIGIRQYLRGINVSQNLLKGIIPIPLQPMAEDEAQRMLAALACHQKISWWDQRVSEAIIENCADLTHATLQFAFDHVVPAVEHSDDPSRLAIDALFLNTIRPHFDHEFYQQFDERLGDYPKAEKLLIHELFRAIARSTKEPKVRSFRDLEKVALKKSTALENEAVDLSELIYALAEDGFLFSDPDQDIIGFASNIVAKWWQVGDRRRSRR